MRGAARSLLLVGAFVLLAWIETYPLFGLDGKSRWFAWDVAEEYWPDQVYLCRQLHLGTLPLWNPHDRLGYPFYADPQAAMFYPPAWVPCLFSANPGVDWASASMLFHLAMAGIFAALLARELGRSWPAALLAGAALMYGPFHRTSWETTLNHTIAYLPLAWLLLLRLFRRPGLPRGVGLGAAMALAAASGSPPGLYFLCLGTVLLGLFLAAHLWRRAGVAGLRPLVAPLGIGALLFAGLTALPLAATIELSRRSVQKWKALEAISTGGFLPAEVLGLFSGEIQPGLYPGLAVMLLAACAWLPRAGEQPRANAPCSGEPTETGQPGHLPLPAWRAFLAGLALLSLLLTLGDHNPFFAAIYQLLPGAAAFRDPQRYGSLLELALVLLCATGLDGLAAVTTHRLARRFPALESPAAAARTTAVIAALVGLCVIADASAYLPPDKNLRDDPLPGGPAALAAVDATLGAPAGAEAPYFDEFALQLRSGTRFSRRDFFGYEDPLMLASYGRAYYSLGEAPALLPGAGVRHLLRGPHFLHGFDKLALPRGKEQTIARPLGDDHFETLAPLPPAYFVAHASVADGEEAAFNAWKAVAPAPVAILQAEEVSALPAALRQSLATKTPPPPSNAASLAAGYLRELFANRSSYDITAPAAGWVVMLEVNYPGWRATIDGVEAPILTANGVFRAVPVAPGAHHLELRFSPWQLRYLGPLWLASLATLLALAARALAHPARRRRST